MKVQQIDVLYAKDCAGTFYSFRAYINESLRSMSRQKDISQVRVVNITEKECVVAYLLELPAEEV